MTIAEKDFEQMGILSSLAEVLYFQAALLETLGANTERDEAAKKVRLVEEKQEDLSKVAVDLEVEEIWETVALVGSGLAYR